MTHPTDPTRQDGEAQAAAVTLLINAFNDANGRLHANRIFLEKARKIVGGIYQSCAYRIDREVERRREAEASVAGWKARTEIAEARIAELPICHFPQVCCEEPSYCAMCNPMLAGAECEAFIRGRHVGEKYAGMWGWKERAEKAEAEVERLRRVCAEAYQVIGVLAVEDLFDHPGVVKMIDNLSFAADGRPIPHDDVLPFTIERAPEAQR